MFRIKLSIIYFMFIMISCHTEQKKKSTRDIINIIIKNSKIEGGNETKMIKDNVYHLIYKENNLTLDEKLDLLFIMIAYHRDATKSYRAKIRNLVKNNDTTILKSKVLLIPISACYYCDNTIANAIKYYQIENKEISQDNLIILNDLLSIIRKKNGYKSSFTKIIKIGIGRKIKEKYNINVPKKD